MSLEQRLTAIREMAKATVEMVDEILVGMEFPPASAPPTECQHPAESRVSTGAMGHPNSFHCMACGQDVGG